MFEDDDPKAPYDEDARAMERLFAGVTLLFFAAICLAIYFYYLLTVGVYGPAQ